MQNQHEQISGYRDLTQEEIDEVNELKRKGNELLDAIDHMRQDTEGAGYDKRAAAIAYTDIQTGMMFAIRAITQPEGHC